MSYKSKFREYAKRVGLEINRYNVAQSNSARVGVQLAHNNVDCVLDVGANDGGFAHFIRSAGFKGDIVSFEPQSAAHEKLAKASCADSAWHVAPRMALGSAETELEINIAGNSTSSSLLKILPSHTETAPTSKSVAIEKVTVKRLDEVDHAVIASAKRIYLKVDTQGYEMQVLLGAQGLIERVVGLQLEMSVIPLYEGQILFQELLSWVEKAGFDVWRFEPGFMDQKTGRMLQFDGIFFRR